MDIEQTSTPDPQKVFGRLVTRACQKLQAQAKKRPLKLKSLNDSLQLTASAAALMASGRDFVQARAALDQAVEKYPANSFAFLLKAITYSSQGDSLSANRYFKTFLIESRVFTGFDKIFLTWAEMREIRKIVYGILQTQNVPLTEEEKKLMQKITFKNLLSYIAAPGPEDRGLNIGFIAVIAGGAAILLLCLFTGVDFSRLLPRLLLILYMAAWVSYGFWIVDLAFGLPFGWNRFKAVPLCMASILGLFFLAELWAAAQDFFRPVEKGYKRCRHCGAATPKLSLECTECRKKL